MTDSRVFCQPSLQSGNEKTCFILRNLEELGMVGQLQPGRRTLLLQ